MNIKEAIFIVFGINAVFLLITKVLGSPSEGLDYEDWKDSDAWKEYLKYYKGPNLHENIIDENDYCQRVAHYRDTTKIALSPLGIPYKDNKVIFSDFQKKAYSKSILKTYGSLVLPEHFTRLHPNMHPYEPLPVNISLFFHHEAFWHHNHLIGQHFLCEGQKYNHIPGSMHMSFKDETVFRIREYTKRYKDREECFRPWQFLPYTLDLTSPEQCQEFFSELLVDQYKPGVSWIVKKSRFSHNGEGITLIGPKEAKEALRQFNNGQDCWEASGYIAQKYISDILLVNDKKFDFRVYMFVASMNPLVILYHDGFVRVALNEYSQMSGENSKHLTNLNAAENFLKKHNATEEGRSDALDAQGWSMKRLEMYLLENGHVKSGWVQHVLKRKFKQTMLHLVRMNSQSLLKHPGVFELFGLDFLMDSSLNVWYIELNLTPCVTEKNEFKRELNRKVLEGVMDLEYALLHNGEFDSILAKTDFEWVFDGRNRGIEKYHNLIETHCI